MCRRSGAREVGEVLLPPSRASRVRLVWQVGFGPISWLIISEVFPLSVRSEGMALAVQTNFFWNLVVAFSFSPELAYIGSAGTFGIFLVLCLVALVFVRMFVPETKGRTLEEIESMLDQKTFSPAQKLFAKNQGASFYEKVHLGRLLLCLLLLAARLLAAPPLALSLRLGPWTAILPGLCLLASCLLASCSPPPLTPALCLRGVIFLAPPSQGEPPLGQRRHGGDAAAHLER